MPSLTLAEERELLEFAPFDMWDHMHRDLCRRLCQQEIDYLERRKETYYNNICYTTTLAWRNV